MNENLLGILLGALGLSLILVTLSVWLVGGTKPAYDSYSGFARFFLVALRVAIGWHCFVEGMEKISSPTWSSEAYLRESIGPLSPPYRWAAGDRLSDKLTVGDDGNFPAELERDWRDYLHVFANYYGLDDKQRKLAEEILEERKAATLVVLTKQKDALVKLAPYPPELTLDMTMNQRIAEHERLLEKLRAIEEKFPTEDKSIHVEWKDAKANLAKWRAMLKKNVDIETEKFKRIDDKLKESLQKNIAAQEAKLKKAKDEKETEKIKKDLDTEKGKLWRALSDVLTSEQKLLDPLPEPIVRPILSWRLLEWSDFFVKWSLVVLGAALMIGLLSRVSGLALALLILSFYLAMPPLPGWPEAPRLEGHYLFVNKTLLEIIALFALTCIPTGRWAGVDALLCMICCKQKSA
jgi:uncharacterized membrane protein YphA (DoxX/SURF4 family)